MYDILTSMWKDPGHTFTPMPFWFWNDRLDKDELVRQIDEFHKKGVDGFIIHPRMGLETEYLSDEYLDMVETCLEAAERRRMMVVLYDEAMYPSGSAHGMVAAEDKRFAARALTARRTSETSEEDEVLYRLFIKLDKDGRLEDVSLDQPMLKQEDTDNVTDTAEVAQTAPVGGAEALRSVHRKRTAVPDTSYVSYDFVLDYTGGTIRGVSPDEDDGMPNAPLAADLLNPYAVQLFTSLTHDRYYERLSRFFGKTVIGFFTDEPSLTGRCADCKGKISWTYDLLEELFECGGELFDLAALLFPVKEKRIQRNAERIYQKTIRHRLNEAYYGTLAAWCREHNVALMGHPAASTDCDALARFDVPGQDLVWRMVTEGTELTSPDSVMAKLAADSARHSGASRNSNECFGMCGEEGNPWNFTPDNMMWYLNFLFARGCNMIIPHAYYYSLRTPLRSNERPPDVGMNSIWWKDQRRISSYIKRMSWLNTNSVNCPDAAVLCSPEHIPLKPVEQLYKKGYTFNYLTVEELMERARIVDGTIRVDQYIYSTLLVDSRLPTSAAIVEKIGRCVVEGGLMYNGTDFVGYLDKHVKRTSYFDGADADALRFVPLNKSGCPFFLLVNEGRTRISGVLVTSHNGAAADFDPFTGATTPMSARMTERGFEYEVEIPPHSVRVIGIDPKSLVRLAPEGSAEGTELALREIVALGADAETGERSFICSSDIKKAVLTFEGIHDIVDVSVNGRSAGRIMFMPYEFDITEHIAEGRNVIELSVTGSMANVYGKPVPVGVDGCVVRLFGGVSPRT